MRDLKILVPLHTLPDVKSVTTIFFESLLSVLKTKVNVHILWLVYTPEKINMTNQHNPSFTILDIHNYQNAVDVMNKEKPDLIYANETWSFIDHALSSAARFCGIPAFCIVYSDIWIKKDITKHISLNIKRFFQRSVPTDTEHSQKKFMKRGRFYLYKYLFLLKTKIAMRREIMQTLFTIWKFVLLDKLDPRFANDTVEFLENESLLNQRIEMGFKKSNLIVTGNPIYDSAFQKLSIPESYSKKNGIIHVLFAPSTLYEHGFWTDKQREYAVKETISQLKNSKEMSITVKIHPSSSVLSDYESLIHSIDSSIPVYQKGDILQFLNDCDVIISFQSSTAEVYGLLARKAIIICNFFDLKGDVFLERGLAIDCKNTSSLIKSIRSALENPVTEQKRDNFVREFMFKWDGRAGERISNKLIELSKK
jgi:hypothetical protein